MPWCFLVLLLATMTSSASAQLRLPLVLGDGAVLQRDHAISVWGWAMPSAPVDVVLGDAGQSTVANVKGRWRVTFPARTAGEVVTLRVESEGERVDARDLVVGDVWVLSGQSNMEWVVQNSLDAEAEIAAAGDPQIRHFKVPQSFADAPQTELAGGAWETESPETVGDFSAVGTFFARAVRQHHDVPIGLLNTSWGGSRIEPWMSAEMLGLSPADIDSLQADADEKREAIRDVLRARIGELPESDAGMEGEDPLWAAPGLDDAEWATIRVPALWEGEGYANLDGVAWYRTSFSLSPDEAADGVTLELGRIDDDDVTWVNGVEVGRMVNGWDQERHYAVPATALREGRNVLAVRVVDRGYAGGIVGASEMPRIKTTNATRSIKGDWRFKVAVVAPVSGGPPNQQPLILWNQMVHPLLPMHIAGVLWYQGESNGGTVDDAVGYGDLFKAMISGWREAWRQPDLPFFWVQLAAYRPAPETPEDTGIWPSVRASQSAALQLPYTAETITLDVGDADDIHPRDKQTVGRRLALAARRIVYGEADLVHSGPRYQSHTVEDGRVAVTFSEADNGLAALGGARLGGFTIAGADGAWHWAEARIESNRVLVWSEAVSAPVAVRYAWADNPEGARLTNTDGLPAAPFEAGR